MFLPVSVLQIRIVPSANGQVEALASRLPSGETATHRTGRSVAYRGFSVQFGTGVGGAGG